MAFQEDALMRQPLTPTEIASQARKILRANRGHRVRISYLHQTLRCEMAALIAVLDAIPDLTRIRGANAAVMLG